MVKTGLVAMVSNNVVLLLIICQFVSGAKTERPCSIESTSSGTSMTSGFIAAALSASGQSGYGTCDSSTGVCKNVLISCPNTSCCLLSSKRSKSCGCLQTVGGQTICVEPNVFQLSSSECTPNQNPNFVNQISFVPASPSCTETTNATLNVLEDGTAVIEISARTCASRTTNKPKTEESDGIVYGVVKIQQPEAWEELGKLFKRMNASELGKLMDLDTLEKAVLYKRSLISKAQTYQD